SIDAVTNSVDAISRNNIQQNQYHFYRISALHGSYLESHIFQSQWAVAAISADKGLRLQAQNIPLLHLTPDNYQSQLPTTNHPAIIKEQITNWLSQGNHAILVTNTDSIDTWSGSTWHIYHPETGHSGYFISGVYAGGQTTQAPNNWLNSELYQQLLTPYSEGANSDPLSAANIKIIAATNNQLGVVNTRLEQPLAVIVRDNFNSPVLQASVTFKIIQGLATLNTIADDINIQAHQQPVLQY
ncbi:MAG: hypothetical protein JKY19_16495, partial [Alcanivoracaceae bacterium]|nr:hypothetical protein [Alcanivoracaceae bacterium]